MLRVGPGASYLADVLPAAAGPGPRHGHPGRAAHRDRARLRGHRRGRGWPAASTTRRRGRPGLIAVAALPLLAGMGPEAYRVAGGVRRAFRRAMPLCAGLLVVGAVIAFATVRPPAAGLPAPGVPDARAVRRRRWRGQRTRLADRRTRPRRWEPGSRRAAGGHWTHVHSREPPRGPAPDPPARRPGAARAARERHGARRRRREVPDVLAGLGPARRRGVRGRQRRRVVRVRPYRLPPRPGLAAPQRLEGPRPGARGSTSRTAASCAPCTPSPAPRRRSASRRSTSAARRSCRTPRRRRPRPWAEAGRPPVGSACRARLV